MVSNNTIKMLLVLSFMIFGNGAINAQKLKKILNILINQS